MTVLVNLYGGPCTGKSVMAMSLTSKIKRSHLEAEYVNEVVKEWAWEKRTPVSFDQFHFFGEQSRREYSKFGQLDFIVSDSPLPLCAYYSRIYGTKEQEATFVTMYKTYRKMCEDSSVKVLDVWLKRQDFPFSSNGRFQTEQEAKEIDLDMQLFLQHNVGIPLVHFPASDGGVDLLYNYVLEFRNEKR